MFEYGTFHPDGSLGADIRLVTMQKIEQRKAEIAGSGLFRLIRHFETINKITFSNERYMKLLRTFSTNNILPQVTINAFYFKMKKLLDSFGESVKPDILVNLEIAGKK